MASIKFTTPTPCACCGATGSNLKFWGISTYGQDASGVASSSVAAPVAINSGDWSRIFSTGIGAIGLKANGTLWFWGVNYYGERGNGVADGLIYAPVQIGSAANWAEVASVGSGIVALKTNGTLWFWGTNSYGQAGNGVADGLVYGLTQIGSASDWLSFDGGISIGVFAIKTNGSLWYWGDNYLGMLGTGEVDSLVHVPTQIGTDTNWIRIASGGGVVGLKASGTLWFWGANLFGYNGSGTTDDTIHEITQISSYSNWESIVANGQKGGVIGLKSDGTLWFWGTNLVGESGSGSADGYIYTISQIGSDSDWVAVSPGQGMGVVGIKANGSIWFWGTNENGERGGGTANSLVYPPTQIGTATNWVEVVSVATGMIGLIE